MVSCSEVITLRMIHSAWKKKHKPLMMKNLTTETSKVIVHCIIIANVLRVYTKLVSCLIFVEMNSSQLKMMRRSYWALA